MKTLSIGIIAGTIFLNTFLAPVASALDQIDAPSEAPISSQPVIETPDQITLQTESITPVASRLLTLPEQNPVAVVTPSEPVLPASPLLITSYRIDNGLVSYVQIYNSSSSLQSLSGWTLNFTIHTAGGDVDAMPIALAGYLPAKKYMVIARQNMVKDSDQEFIIDPDAAFLSVAKLALSSTDFATDKRTMTFVEATRYDLSQSTAGNYTATSKYITTDPGALLTGGGWYNFTESTSLRAVEILANSANCPPLSEAKNCFDYVKLQNQSDQPIDLNGYRLRLGYGNASPSIDTSIPLAGTLLSGKFLTVNARSDGKPLDIVASGGNVWLEDMYGLHTYSETIISYQNLGDTVHKGMSWALDASDMAWKWAIATPDGENNFATVGIGASGVPSNELKACAENQYRSPETNRCRLIETSASTLKPCKDGQYRSEETNRCRSIAATVAAELKPCADDQFRNPATGRCKKIASTDDLPKPCAIGQERNPETNRCRKVVATNTADVAFAPEPIKQTAKSFIGWWALGGITLFGLGYAVWEWRYEVRQGVLKVVSAFHRPR